MIQTIQVNIQQAYVGMSVNGYTRTVSTTNQTAFTTTQMYQIGSTMVFVNGGYQSFTSYVENSGLMSITFLSGQANGAIVEIRYNQAL